jgi:hypothetical protein
MAIYTDVFLAPEAELQAARLETAHPSNYFPTVSAKNCTEFEFAKLEAILEGQDPYTLLDERLRAFALIQEYENCWVYQLPDRLAKMLADLTFSEAENTANIWAHTEELRPRDGRPVDSSSLREYLQQVAQLAMRAQQEGKRLYLWIGV